MKTIIKFKNQTVTYLKIDHRLEYEMMKKEIDTRVVEHLTVRVGKKNFDAWICEEGLLRNLKPEAIMMHNGEPYNHLAGTVLLSKTDKTGYACGLTDDEVKYVVENLRGANMTIELDNDEVVTGDFPLFEYGY
jgi:hypothetical protein